MKTIHTLALVFGVTLAINVQAQTGAALSPKDTEPLMLDIARFYNVRYATAAKANEMFGAIRGRQTVDGLPFQIEGEAILFGSANAEAAPRKSFPQSLTAIVVGRPFDELHLIHVTKRRDAEGQPIARIRLNYADGTTNELPILYGGHVRDGQRQQHEEKELLTDPDSKVFWRGPGEPNLNSTARVFKSTLRNPQPGKRVETLDVISTRSLAAYSLMAATVAKADPNRPITPPKPADEPERNFDGRLTIRVVDGKTQQPVAGALVVPTMDTDGRNLIAGPFFTSTTGEGIVRFPTGRTKNISATAKKEGFGSASANVTVETDAPRLVEMELAPTPKITGVVRQPDGQPAAGLPVRIVGSFMSSDVKTETDAQGRFEIEWTKPQAIASFSEPAYCLLIRDPGNNLAVAEEIDETTGPLDLRLAPGLTLVGQVECDGKPVANADATLVFWAGGSGMHLTGLSVGTNTPGRFEIPALPPSRRYHVMVSAPGHGRSSLVEVNSSEAGRVEVGPVELRLANLKLAGKVLNAADKPVTNAQVRLSGDDQPFATASTDREGRFIFENVCEGQIRLSASSRMLRGSTSAEAGDTNVVLKVERPTAGEVSSSGAQRLTGVVTDPAGKLVAGAQVAVFPYGGGKTKTDAKGVFNLTWSRRSTPFGSPSLVVRDTTRDLATVEDLSEDNTNLNVQLKPALTLAGRVEGPDGIPLTNGQVSVLMASGRSFSSLDSQSIATDSRGQFMVTALPMEQEYHVLARAKGFSQSRQEIQAPSETNWMELEPFVLRVADKVLAGQVVNSADKPMSGVHVSLSGDDQPSESATTDGKGRFRFQVCEGQVRLFASGSSGYASVTAEAGDTNVTVQLGRSLVSIRQPATRSSLKGKPLPDIATLGLGTDAVPAGQPLLLCLFDSEQRPSRRCVRLLAEQHGVLKQKGLTVLAIQAVVTTAESWQTWKAENSVPFSVGCVTEKSEKTKWATGTASLPRLILTDAQGKVVADGFALEDLDAQFKTLTK